jgi:DNA primase catalytic core
MHGLLAGDESRQQAYTMLTRGRHTNTAYVVVVGDGDIHSTIRPETINPLTPTDVLERVLAKDESPISATTSLRQASDPRHLLGQAAGRYADAIVFAVEHEAGAVGIRALERAVDAALPRLTDAATWPALRGQLLQAQASGIDPIDTLAKACVQPLTGGHDPASVLAWRVADQRRQHGPLPWLSDIPQKLTEHPIWGDYLAARRGLVEDLASQVRAETLFEQRMPEWVGGITGRPPADLIADVEVWRAANQVPTSDQRPTGEPITGMAATRWQHHLDQRLADSQTAALSEWRGLLNQVRRDLANDDFAPTLAHRLSQLSSGGLDAATLVREAASEGPLPDDHAAAALWWRITGKLTPALTADVDADHHSTSAWLDRFTDRVGTDTSALVQTSSWWPALSTTIERGLQRGWPLESLLDEVAGIEPDGHSDLCQAWMWRLSLFTDTLPLDEYAEAEDVEFPRPDDLDEVLQEWAPATAIDMVTDQLEPLPAEPQHTDLVDLSDDDQLAFEALVRATLPIPEPTDADVRRQMDYRDQIAASSITPQRLLEINELAAAFYQSNLPRSWAQPYLENRFGASIDELPDVRPGYAPAEWRSLLQHLSRHGVSTDEAITAGLAKRNEDTGTTYDRLRDRVVFPVVHDGQVLGFVGRRNPDFAGDETFNPKYYNSPDTPVFHKGAQLFVAGSLDGDAVPVLVEGPMDAIATTLASQGRMVGVAPLGTSLTEQQVAQLHATGTTPVVATDGDLAGRVAAERDYWLLAPYKLHATHATLPEGSDPASMVEAGQAEQLVTAINAARPLAETLIDERLANIDGPSDAVLAAVQVLAAQPADTWASGAEHIAEQSGVPSTLVRSALLSHVRAWNTDARQAAQHAAWQVSQVKDRLAAIKTEQHRHDNPETVQHDETRPNPQPDTQPQQRGVER